MAYVHSGNKWATEPDYVAKLAVFCKRIEEVERKKKELYDEIQSLEDLAYQEDFHFFNVDDLYRLDGCVYDADSEYKDWLASNHNC